MKKDRVFFQFVADVFPYKIKKCIFIYVYTYQIKKKTTRPQHKENSFFNLCVCFYKVLIGSIFFIYYFFI